MRDIIRVTFRYRDLLKQLVMKDLKLKYRRSFLGYLWSILNPLMIMLVMIMVFSKILRFDTENYPVYLIIGQTIYNYMSNSTSQNIFSIIDNGALLKKIYVPKYIFPIAKATSGLIDFLFSLGALVLVMIITRTPFRWYIILLPFVILQLYFFCMGVGIFLSQASVFFRDTQYIYAVILTAWMYCTPIFYPVEVLPEKLKWIIMHLNPMFFYIQEFRLLVLDGVFPSWRLIGRGCFAAILMLLIGLGFFKRNQDKFILFI